MAATLVERSGSKARPTQLPFLSTLLSWSFTGTFTDLATTWPALTQWSRIILFVLQLCYVYHVFASDEDLVIAALDVGSHFMVNNVLQFAFIMLWVRSHFWIAELVLVINAFNLKALYLRYTTTPSFIHIPVVSGPWAWTFVALFWNGAVAVDTQILVARIVANVAIWSFLLFGLFYLAVYRDYTVGFELSFLSTGNVCPWPVISVALNFQLTQTKPWVYSNSVFTLLACSGSSLWSSRRSFSAPPFHWLCHSSFAET